MAGRQPDGLRYAEDTPHGSFSNASSGFVPWQRRAETTIGFEGVSAIGGYARGKKLAGVKPAAGGQARPTT
jgi:hypothetical protein